MSEALLSVSDMSLHYGRREVVYALTFDVALADDTAHVKGNGTFNGFDPAALVWGSVEQVTEKFRALAAMGYTDVIVRHLTDEQGEVLGSLERLARVREALRSA